MNYNDFIQPREITIGNRCFAVSKIPALVAQSEIYPAVAKALSSDGALGLTMLPTRVVSAMLAYTAERTENGSWFELDSVDRVNKAFPDIKDMHRLVVEMTKENFGFLTDGSLREVLGVLGAEAESDL
jgi:hypothetical protein